MAQAAGKISTSSRLAQAAVVTKATSAHQFKAGDAVFMRDSPEEKWCKGVVATVNPLMIRFPDGSPNSYWSFPEVRARNINEEEGSMEEQLDRNINLQVSAPASKDTTVAREVTLSYFDPEDEKFWSKGGKEIAYVNLAISTVALFLGFAIWAQWGAVAKNVIAAHKNDVNVYAFGYTDAKEHKAAVNLLVPISGISGATSRVVHAWSVNPCGGRTTTVGSCVCIALSMFTAGFTLMNGNASIWLLYFSAVLSGIGGGIFSSSVSNVSFWFPSKLQGTALGIDGGFGNLGVAAALFLVPRFAKYGACLAGVGGTCEAGTIGNLYAYNPFFFWGVFALVVACWAYIYMNNMPKHGRKFTKAFDASSNCPQRTYAALKGAMQDTLFKYFAQIQLCGYVASVVVSLIFIGSNKTIKEHAALVVARSFLLSLVAFATAWVLLFYCGFGHVKTRLSLQRDTGILKDVNTIIMCLLYTMTFGSFIGYSAAFPQLISDLFERDASDYVYIGPLCGSLSRVAGGVLSDYMGGAMLTQICAIVQLLSTLIAAIIIRVALSSDDTSSLFQWFVVFFIILFTATGLGNGSTFKQIATLCKDNPEKRGTLLGYSGSIAAYGAFIIPTLCRAGVDHAFIDVVFFGFSLYYGFCAVLNYWAYYRPDAPFPC